MSTFVNPVDDRIDIVEREAVAVQLARRKPLCCAGKFLHDFLKKFINNWRDFFGSEVQAVVKGLAWFASRNNTVGG